MKSMLKYALLLGSVGVLAACGTEAEAPGEDNAPNTELVETVEKEQEKTEEGNVYTGDEEPLELDESANTYSIMDVVEDEAGRTVQGMTGGTEIEDGFVLEHIIKFNSEDEIEEVSFDYVKVENTEEEGSAGTKEYLSDVNEEFAEIKELLENYLMENQNIDNILSDLESDIAEQSENSNTLWLRSFGDFQMSTQILIQNQETDYEALTEQLKEQLPQEDEALETDEE